MPRTRGIEERAKVNARNSLGYMFGQYGGQQEPRTARSLLYVSS